MHFLLLSASRNIGPSTALFLLGTPTNVCTLLLRSPLATRTACPALEPHLQSGQLRIVEGDTTIQSDVEAAFVEAGRGAKNGVPDQVIYSIGATKMKGFSLTKGVKITPADGCASTILPVLRHLHSIPVEHMPRLIAISSSGLGQVEHSKLPLLFRPLSGWLLHFAHEDKLVLEYLLHHSAGLPWPSTEPIPAALPANWSSGISPPGFLKELIVVRPVLLIDTDSSGREYRVSDAFEKLPWTISREAVARFIVKECVGKGSQWVGKCPVIGW